jgi:long-chain fatty acid transport protein
MNHYGLTVGFRPLLGLSLVAVAALEVDAVSFRLPNQDPEAIARGNAFVATADNPSAIYYNPAGIAQLEGEQIRVGGYFVSADTKFTGPSGTAHTDSTLQPVPQVYYTFSPKDTQFSFGLGLYAPYGLALDWGDNNPFATLAQNGKVLYACLNPVVAWKPCSTFSIAVGPTINYSQAKFERAIGLGPGDQFSFKGDGWDYGFNAGLLWKPHEKVAVGASYRYLTDVNYEGHSEFSPYAPRTETSGSIRYPQFIVGGISFRPTENWNFEVDVDWTDWDNVNRIIFTGTAFPTPPFELNYRSSFMYEFGATRQLPHGYFVSVGYFYSENSSPNADFNPIVPDSNLHLGSIGFGHHGKHWDWAAAYHFGYNGSGRVVTGTPGGLADGRYETFNNAFNIAATFKF